MRIAESDTGFRTEVLSVINNEYTAEKKGERKGGIDEVVSDDVIDEKLAKLAVGDHAKEKKKQGLED